jgi:hypothetical protein
VSLGAAVLVGTIALAAWRSGRSTGPELPRDTAMPPVWPETPAAVVVPTELQQRPAAIPTPLLPAERPSPGPRVEPEPAPDRRSASVKRRTRSSGPVNRVGDGALNPFERSPAAQGMPRSAPPPRGVPDRRHAGVVAKPHR